MYTLTVNTEFGINFQSDDDSGNDSDGSEPSGKRQRFDADKLERRREKRLWEEKRSKILFEYTEFSGFGTSVSLSPLTSGL